MQVAETRNYGATANDKAVKLIQKLLFATAAVVALVFIALGRREAAIVGSAVILTLTVTLFASWAWGFTLNRVSLFALIFSIGILVDDAIVVVENIHRHQQLHPGKTLVQLIPGAVDEVGGPTILATLTVIAALLPMAFVSGLMGPVHEPDPDQRQHGHAAVAGGRLRRHAVAGAPVDEGDAGGAAAGTPSRTACRRAWRRSSSASSRRCSTTGAAARNRRAARAGRGGADRHVACCLPAIGLVRAEDAAVRQQVGVPGRRRHAGRHAGGADRCGAARARRPPGARVPEVTDYQAYAGTAAPINFNGLVRQYYLRSGGEVGDMQVNLVDKHQRDEQSHAIATRVRPALQAIGQRHGANVKVVEVPPGPPVLSPLVAEIYGPEAEGRREVAQAVRGVFAATPGVVDVDDSSIADAPRKLLLVDRRKAAMLGVSQQEIVDHAARRPGRRGHGLPARPEQVPGRGDDPAARRSPGRPRCAAAAVGAQRRRQARGRSANW